MNALLRAAIFRVAALRLPVAQTFTDRLQAEVLKRKFVAAHTGQPLSLSDAPGLAAHLAAVCLPTLPVPTAQWTTFAVETLVGPLHLAMRWLRPATPDQPVVIYHHGAAEMPPELCLARALASGEGPPAAGVLLIRAAGHTSMRAYARLMHDVRGSLAMLSASAAAMEAARQMLAGGSPSKRPLLIMGISMGGFISLLHLARFGGQALAESPAGLGWCTVACGPALQQVPAMGVFARLFATRSRSGALDHLMDVPWQTVPAGVWRRCWALHGCYDTIFLPRTQRAAWQAVGVQPAWVRRGHLGLALDGAAVRAHLDRALRLLIAGQAAAAQGLPGA